MEANYPPRATTTVITPTPEPLPTSVTETWDEASQRYTYTFTLDKDERDAMVMFGTHPIMEADGHVVRRAEAIIKGYAQAYANQCFNDKVPVDCYCERTLFRRMCEKRKEQK